MNSLVHKAKPLVIAAFKVLAILIGGGVLLFGIAAGAEGFDPPTESRLLEELIAGISKMVLMFAIPVLVLAVLWAGFRIVTAQDNDKQLTDAKRLLYWTLVGAAIVIAAPTLADIVLEFFK